jgi:subtilisin family serine protease
MNVFRYRFSATLLLFLTVAALHARDTENYNGHDVVAKQAILQLNLTQAGVQLPVLLSQLATAGAADDLRPLNRALGIYLLHSSVSNVTALLNILKNVPGITLVEPDYIVHPVGTPNDPNFPSQWDMLNTSTPGADIGATLAWNVSTGSTANVIGVVDTGVDYTHPDLAANVWSAPAQFTVTLSWGQITCPAGSHGYNAVARTCNPADDNQHGTHVSGTIGAIGNNGTGVAGINWTARIMALKFLDSTGSGSLSDAIDAIEFGLQAKTIFGSAANVRVFSNSWGGSGFSQSLLNEINKAGTADVLFVVAAGNSASNDDTSPTYPASYTAANMITVAATTNTDAMASFSNYGHTTVHLGAPGLNILSTLPNAGYGYLSGTSMATPHVSGAAMLVLSTCSLNTAGVKSVLLANVDVISSLQGITVTGGRLNVNKAIRSCASTAPTGAATFVNTDAATSGSWKGVYGAEGYNLIASSTAYPSYVTATPAGNLNYTWAASTTDTRGVQKAPPATDRVAACWYSSTNFTVDLSFTDANTHQVGFYMLDWDAPFGGRSQKVDILDANGTLLDSRSVTSFTSGQYLVWNLSGHVVARFTNTGVSGNNAVLSAILFGGAGGSGTSSGTAAFLKTDTAPAGSWKTAYGAEGYNVISNASAYPSYVTVNSAGYSNYIWASTTADTRGLQKASPATDRIAACWYSATSFTVDLAFNDANTHQIAIYLLDWDAPFGGRSQRVDVLDTNGNILDTRSVTSFTGGQYLVWNLSGHVVVRATNTGISANNAVISGIFFGGAPAATTATFVKTDTTTSGSWKGVYGADGYNVIDDTITYPSYVTVTPSGNLSYLWTASTSDPRGAQKVASTTDRIAACWYSATSMTIDLAFNDSNTHQVALYLLDWDAPFGGRSQRIDILDVNGNVLDTRSVTNFTAGQYLVWNLSGHAVARITNTGISANNGVVSAIFFR